MIQNKYIVVALDGHSSCGKSTLSKQLAKHFNFLHIDTGAMYRCVTLIILEQNISIDNDKEIQKLLYNLKIYFKNLDDGQHVYINGRDVTQEIREQKISDYVSEVAAVSKVRKKLVEQQQVYGNESNLIMDGRDIGTVVYPNASLKIFLTANETTRAQRRFEELKAKGKKVSFEKVLENIKKRDHIDSTREDSPLKKAEDAIVIDNSELSESQQFDKVKALIDPLLVN